MSERIYRLLLLAYPRLFRETHGEELLDAFRYSYTACCRAEGTRGWAIFWLTAAWDALSNGLLLRLHPAARKRVGDFEIPTDAGEGWSVGWGKDIRYAFRQLRRAPGFSLTVILTLALGIGANSAIFSLVYGVLIAPLPFSLPERSVVLTEHARNADSNLVSPITFYDWSDRNRCFEELAAFRFWENRSVELSAAESIPVLQVTATPNFFRALGWQPALGRTYGEENQAGASEAVLSHQLWISAFGGSPDVLGRSVRLSGSLFTVVGVMPPIYNDPALGLGDIWTPLHRYNLQQQRTSSYRDRYLGVVGRLKSGMSLALAQAEMTALQSQLANETTSVAKGFEVRLELLPEVAGRSLRPVLLALFGAVILVLVIACANVASLVLTKAASHAREYSVRIALGARRFHLARQMMTESLLLSTVGGVAGLFFASWTVDLLKATLTDRIPRLGAVTLNGPVLAFTGILICLVAVTFSLTPIVGFGSSGLHQTLKEAGRDGLGLGRNRLRRALVAAEVALAVLLLCGAGLILRSFGKLLSVDPGFASRNRIVADIILPSPFYGTDAKRIAYFRDLFQRLAKRPEFSSAGAALYFPCRPKIWFSTIWLEGSTTEPGLEPIVTFNLFASDFFQTMGIPLRQGRLPREEEMWTDHRVALVNQTMAGQLFPTTGAVGKRFRTSLTGPWTTVIGVVGDVHQGGLDSAPRPEFYVPFSAMPMPFLTVVLTSRMSPEAAISELRLVAREGAPDLKIENAANLVDLVANTLTLRRLALLSMGMFAALSLALAGVGTYGVVSYSVGQRTREIGVRMALGSTAMRVVRLVVMEGLQTVSFGVALGLLLTAFAGPAIQSLLYDIPPLDPEVFAAVPVLMIGVAGLACLIPALRAARTDPILSLRCD